MQIFATLSPPTPPIQFIRHTPATHVLPPTTILFYFILFYSILFINNNNLHMTPSRRVWPSSFYRLQATTCSVSSLRTPENTPSYQIQVKECGQSPAYSIFQTVTRRHPSPGDTTMTLLHTQTGVHPTENSHHQLTDNTKTAIMSN